MQFFKKGDVVLLFDERVYDLKVYKYMQEVATGKRIACKELIILCNKLLKDIERSKEEDFPYYFDTDKSIAIDNFISLLRFPSGRKVGEPVELVSFQDFIVKNIFCWREKRDKTVVRFTDCLILLPRKQGKSFFCAILGIIAMMIEENAEVANGAVALSQAKVIINQAKQLLKTNPELAKHFKIYTSYIEFKGSTFKPLSSKALDGANFNVAMLDEANEASRELMESMTSGFSQRKSYQSYYITTEYPINKKSFWFDELKDDAVKAMSGLIDNERIIAFIYKLDNAEEVSNPDMYIKANPMIELQGSEFWENEYKKKCNNPNALKNFLIKNMNIPETTSDDNGYLDIEKWKACRSEEPIDWRRVHVNVGVDLSKSTDLTAVSFTGTDEEGNVLVHSHGFLPEDSLLSGNRREKIDYRKMERLGYCTINRGGVIDYNIVKEYIMNIEEKFGCIIDSICFDMYNALQMFTELSQEGFNVLEQKQNILSLSYPTKTFREKVYLGQVKYDKNELLDWCVSCAITEEDRNGNEKISKNKSQKNNKRIDMIAAVIFSYAETVKTEIKPKFNIDAFGIIDC